MDAIQDLGEHLHRYGLKNTKARNAVLQLLLAKSGVLTPDSNCFDNLSDVGNVYRKRAYRKIIFA